jgi:hypothetical protein
MRPALVDADGLQVGQPPALGLVHRVADVVARQWTLTAHVTSLGHNRASVPKRPQPDKAAAAGRVRPAPEREWRFMAVTRNVFLTAKAAVRDREAQKYAAIIGERFAGVEYWISCER